MPASTRASIRSAVEVAGPSVHTILALRTRSTLLGQSDHQWAFGRRDRRRKRRGTGEVSVHGCSRGATFRDRPHDERLAAAGIACDEHARHRRLVLAVPGDVAALVNLDAELLDQ